MTDYTNAADREKIEARLRALSIAHNQDMPPAEVVGRAKAYIEFVEAD